MQRHPHAVAAITAWAQANGYDAAIWTALASRLHEPGKRGEPFMINAAIRYLEDLEKRDAATFGSALTYIRKAPIEVQRWCAMQSKSAGHDQPQVQAAATAVRHVVIAAARSARCVWAERRWRWTLKVL